MHMTIFSDSATFLLRSESNRQRKILFQLT